jgi:acyl carrier protein
VQFHEQQAARACRPAIRFIKEGPRASPGVGGRAGTWDPSASTARAGASTADREGTMDREQLRATLLELLQEEMGEDYPSLTDEVELKDGLNLDSVDVVGLVMRIERELRIRLSMNHLEEVRTVGDLLDLLRATMAAASKGAGVADRAPQSTAA